MYKYCTRSSPPPKTAQNYKVVYKMEDDDVHHRTIIQLTKLSVRSQSVGMWWW